MVFQRGLAQQERLLLRQQLGVVRYSVGERTGNLKPFFGSGRHRHSGKAGHLVSVRNGGKQLVPQLVDRLEHLGGEHIRGLHQHHHRVVISKNILEMVGIDLHLLCVVKPIVGLVGKFGTGDTRKTEKRDKNGNNQQRPAMGDLPRPYAPEDAIDACNPHRPPRLSGCGNANRLPLQYS